MRRLSLILLLTSGFALSQPVPLPKPNYCFSFLRAVPNRLTLPQPEVQRIQAEHIAHLNALAEKRWLVGGGPILSANGPRGILISKCASVAEANEFASADPAVKNGRLLVETFAWNGPAGIGDRYWAEKARDPDAPDRMLKYAVVLLTRAPLWKDWPPKETLLEHFRYVASLTRRHRLVAAGPFPDSQKEIGVFVFEETSLDAARQLAGKDPLVAGGHAVIEVYEWMAAGGTFPRHNVPPGTVDSGRKQ